jgi:hypothetical protein
MNTLTLTEIEKQTLAGALHVACEVYRKHISELPSLTIDSVSRRNIKDIFSRQLSDCQRLLVLIEG